MMTIVIRGKLVTSVISATGVVLVVICSACSSDVAVVSSGIMLVGSEPVVGSMVVGSMLVGSEAVVGSMVVMLGS